MGVGEGDLQEVSIEDVDVIILENCPITSLFLYVIY